MQLDSRYEWGHRQANGKRFVVEFHTDEAGNVYRYEYGPMADDFEPGPEVVMNNRAAELNAQLAAGRELVPFIRGAA